MMLKALSFLSASLFIFATSALSAETLVECTGFDYGDTEKVVIFQEDGSYYLSEIDFEGEEFTKEISEESYINGEFRISSIRVAYRRTILRTDEGWKLKFSCGEIHDLTCTEF